MTINFFINCLSICISREREGVEVYLLTHTQSPNRHFWGIYSQWEAGQSIIIDVDVTLRAHDQSRLYQCPDSLVGVIVVCCRKSIIGLEHNANGILYPVLSIFQSTNSWINTTSRRDRPEKIRIVLPHHGLLSPWDPSELPVRKTLLIGFHPQTTPILL